jgi:hypothetical protein
MDAVDILSGSRKDVIDRFVSEASLSKAGASTYFQNINAKWLENNAQKSTEKKAAVKKPAAKK